MIWLLDTDPNTQGTILTILYAEVFAPNSIPNWFNSIHNRIKADPRCTKLLGGSIKAYGEPTSNRWARNRPIAYVSLSFFPSKREREMYCTIVESGADGLIGQFEHSQRQAWHRTFNHAL